MLPFEAIFLLFEAIFYHLKQLFAISRKNLPFEAMRCSLKQCFAF
jgi:hypothetical protein